MEPSSDKAHLSPLEEAFWSTNYSKWPPPQETKPNDYLFLEGVLSDYGPNYLYRTGLIARAILDSYPELQTIVLYDRLLHFHKRSISLYKSFGFRRHLSFAAQLRSPIYKLYVRFLCSGLFSALRVSTGEELLRLKFKGIHIGDLIYDSITANLKHYKTIETIKSDMKPFIRRAIYDVLLYEFLFKKYRPKFLVSTHPCYVLYGTMCRVALKHGTRVILTTDIEVAELTRNPDPQVEFSPVFHEFVGEYIRSKMGEFSNPRIKIEDIKSYLRARLNGEVDQIDVKLAYTDKLQYSEKNLRDRLGLDQNRPIVFIFAHVISDAPHCSHFLLFKDYFDWLKSTLEMCQEITDVYWVVKPHPAAKVYSEDGVVEQLVKEANCEHVKLVPADFNTSSAFLYAHALVTVHGTAGLEFSCYGIPVVLAGRPFYSDLGFTTQPEDRKTYHETLKKIYFLPKLSSQETDKALLTMAAFKTYSLTENLVLKSDLLMKVWGYQDRDIDVVMKEMTKNLTSIDPKNEPQFIRAKEILSNS